MPTCRSLPLPSRAASAGVHRPAARAGDARHADTSNDAFGPEIRYGLGSALAGADIDAASPNGGGTSKAEIGVASSSARSRPRVARPSGIRIVQTIRFCHCAVSTVAVFAACHGLSRSRPCTTLHSLSASRCCLEQVEGAGDPGTQAIRIAPVGPADREHRAAGARQDAEQRQRAPPRRQPARTV